MADHHETLRTMIEEIFGKGRMELFDQAVHEDFIDHTAAEGMPPDREGFRGWCRASTAASVMSPQRSNGAWWPATTSPGVGARTLPTPAVVFTLGASSSGNRIEITGNDLGVMRDGKLAESWGEMDTP
ncbi:MAG: hypothetical protein U5Q44_02670 [Dehalococcoidia bacterium]|nr:hypothetical protein [Dehalococcoidia bacterium]